MKDLDPLRESQVRRNDRTHSLVSRCQQLEKQFCACEIERDIPKLVDDQEIDLPELLDING